MREYVATAKTVEEAIQLGCEALSVDRDDLGVSYEILEMPQKTGFLGLKVTPAKVKVTVEPADTEPETTPAAPVAAAEPEPAPAEEAAEQPAAEDAAPAEAETPLDIAADPRLQRGVFFGRLRRTVDNRGIAVDDDIRRDSFSVDCNTVSDKVFFDSKLIPGSVRQS